MKPEPLYQNLNDLAEKLNVRIVEKNLRKTGLRVKSGLCKVKGEYLFIMDKHLSIRNKNELLGQCLKDISHEEVYIVPAVRDFIAGCSEPVE